MTHPLHKGNRATHDVRSAGGAGAPVQEVRGKMNIAAITLGVMPPDSLLYITTYS